MELSEQLRIRNSWLSRRWVPRLQNQDADDLTNGRFEKFDERLRIHIVQTDLKFRFSKIPMKLLENSSSTSRNLRRLRFQLQKRTKPRLQTGWNRGDKGHNKERLVTLLPRLALLEAYLFVTILHDYIQRMPQNKACLWIRAFVDLLTLDTRRSTLRQQNSSLKSRLRSRQRLCLRRLPRQKSRIGSNGGVPGDLSKKFQLSYSVPSIGFAGGSTFVDICLIHFHKLHR